MRLFVMRHGPAIETAPSGRDFDRPLSPSGRGRTSEVAQELLRRGERVERILSSPLVRARQTAELVRQVFPGVPVEVCRELAPGEDGSALVRELLAEGEESALLVSHAPDVSLLSEGLLGARVGAFQPGTVLALEVVAGKTTRRFVVD